MTVGQHVAHCFPCALGDRHCSARGVHLLPAGLSEGENAKFSFSAVGGTTYQLDVQLGTLDDSVLSILDRDSSTVRPQLPPPHVCCC